MGWNTTVFILNDGFDQLQKNPDDFVAKIAEKMHDGGEVGVGNHANCVRVMRSGHADYFRLYGSHRNTMIELSPYSAATSDLVDRFPDVVRNFVDYARMLLDELEASLPPQ